MNISSLIISHLNLTDFIIEEKEKPNLFLSDINYLPQYGTAKEASNKNAGIIFGVIALICVLTCCCMWKIMNLKEKKTKRPTLQQQYENEERSFPTSTRFGPASSTFNSATTGSTTTHTFRSEGPTSCGYQTTTTTYFSTGLNDDDDAPVVVTSSTHTPANTGVNYPVDEPIRGYQSTQPPYTANTTPYPMPQPTPVHTGVPYPINDGMPMPQAHGQYQAPQTGYQAPYPPAQNPQDVLPPSYDQVVGGSTGAPTTTPYNKQSPYNPHYAGN